MEEKVSINPTNEAEELENSLKKLESLKSTYESLKKNRFIGWIWLREALEDWEEEFDLIDLRVLDFTNYYRFGHLIPPTRYELYNEKIVSLARSGKNPEMLLTSCRELEPCKINLEAFTIFPDTDQDEGYIEWERFSSKQIQRLEKIFDREWAKPTDASELVIFVAYAPPSRQHLVAEKIAKTQSMELEFLQDCSQIASRHFESFNDKKMIDDVWKKESMHFYVHNNDPVILANNTELMHSDSERDYPRLAMENASRLIVNEILDEDVWKALKEIENPYKLDKSAWKRFYRTAKNTEEVKLVIKNLVKGVEHNSKEECLQEIFKFMDSYFPQEILNSCNIEEALKILDKLPELRKKRIVKEQTLYEHLIWLYQAQIAEKMQYDPDHTKRNAQKEKKINAIFETGYQLVKIFSKELGRQSPAALLAGKEFAPYLKDRAVCRLIPLDQLREMSKILEGEPLFIAIDAYAAAIKKEKMDEREQKTAKKEKAATVEQKAAADA